jgi:hypothetical protein
MNQTFHDNSKQKLQNQNDPFIAKTSKNSQEIKLKIGRGYYEQSKLNKVNN